MQPLNNASIGELLQKNMPRCIKIQLRLEEILKISRMHELAIRNTDRAMDDCSCQEGILTAFLNFRYQLQKSLPVVY